MPLRYQTRKSKKAKEPRIYFSLLSPSNVELTCRPAYYQAGIGLYVKPHSFSCQVQRFVGQKIYLTTVT
jgi:hypothetical protein